MKTVIALAKLGVRFDVSPDMLRYHVSLEDADLMRHHAIEPLLNDLADNEAEADEYLRAVIDEEHQDWNLWRTDAGGLLYYLGRRMCAVANCGARAEWWDTRYDLCVCSHCLKDLKEAGFRLKDVIPLKTPFHRMLGVEEIRRREAAAASGDPTNGWRRGKREGA